MVSGVTSPKEEIQSEIGRIKGERRGTHLAPFTELSAEAYVACALSR
jgi:hypothetical protein